MTGAVSRGWVTTTGHEGRIEDVPSYAAQLESWEMAERGCSLPCFSVRFLGDIVELCPDGSEPFGRADPV